MKHKRLPAVASAIASLSLLVALSGLVGLPGHSPTSTVQAQAVAQSYPADTALQAGIIVRLADDKSKVLPVTQAEAQKMYGVVVRPNDAPLSLSDDKTAQQVYVATGGNYQVLVSNQNGPIKQGDYIVLSAIEGVGMKVDASSIYVIGKALNDFDGSGTDRAETTVKDSAGRERTVKIGYVRIDVAVGRSPLRKGSVANVPGVLQKAADSIAGKAVSAIRVYISLVVVLISGVIVSSVLYAGIRTSIIALGRNPLARKSIVANLIRVILLGLTILIVGVFAVYLLLKL